MSNLRQKKREVVTEVDVEAHPPISPITRDAPKSPAPSFTPSSIGRSNNPFYLARLILRKVLDLLVGGDDESEDITTLGGIIALLRDIVIGIFCGSMIVSFLMFLDHKDVIHLQSAHNYRQAMVSLLSDPGIREDVQESSGLIFMMMEDYQLKVKEIEKIPGEVKKMEEKKIISDANLEAATKERDAIKPGYDKLVSDPLLGLDTYCGACFWQGKTNCNARKEYLMSTYNLGEIKAKLDMIKTLPQCVKKA